VLEDTNYVKVIPHTIYAVFLRPMFKYIHIHKIMLVGCTLLFLNDNDIIIKKFANDIAVSRLLQ